MLKKCTFSLFLAAFFLSACSDRPRLFPVEGAPTGNPSSVAQIREGSLLLRGLDRKKFDISTIPNPTSDFVYAIQPGIHTLWGMNIPGGHPLFPEGLRCYTITDVTLEPGVIYRIDESREQAMATIKREDTGTVIGRGQMVDRKSAFTDACKWE